MLNSLKVSFGETIRGGVSSQRTHKFGQSYIVSFNFQCSAVQKFQFVGFLFP